MEPPEGAFAEAALNLLEHGLAPIPVGDQDGKVPLVSKFNRWRRPPKRTTVESWVKRHSTANVAIVTGAPSKVMVVDIDDPEIVAQVRDRCGDTPLESQTPRGGVHLFYRYTPADYPPDLKHEGLLVDIKARSGIIVVPPSKRLSEPMAGVPYRFVKGSLDDLAELPPVRPGSLLSGKGSADQSPGRVPVGSRFQILRSWLLRQVKHCDTFDDLLDVACTWAADNLEQNDKAPFTDEQIVKLVSFAWELERKGENWVGQEARVTLTDSEIRDLTRTKQGINAMALLVAIRRAHKGRRTLFPVSPKGIANAQSIAGLGAPKTIREARDFLMDHGYLELVTPPNSYIGKAALYRETPNRRGEKTAPYIIGIPPSPAHSAPNADSNDGADAPATTVASLPRRRGDD